MGDKPRDLTELIHLETKEFVKNFKKTYEEQKLRYHLRMYQLLTQCYQTHITEQAAKELNSDAMLGYYQCYKQTLRQAKNNNQKLYDEGLNNDKKLKYCLEIKSTFSKTVADFEDDRRQCLTDYRDKYIELYENFFHQNAPNIPSETASASQSPANLPPTKK